MTDSQISSVVPVANDSNTMTLGDIRKNFAHAVNRADYGNNVTYIKNATERGRIVAAVVPVVLLADYALALGELETLRAQLAATQEDGSDVG
ncbi:hypothetical protein ACIPRL_07890 [Streptomyces sp. NPDC090085]|uniref:hypothetical protein n=1 Tax=Streptomyces sp. NPDC090085 TaxID=3365943 RepID=UPI00381947F8